MVHPSNGPGVGTFVVALLRKSLGRISARLLSLTRERQPNLAERLGYSPRMRLLIVHADDLGFARAVNAAFFAAAKTGLVNSGSAMVPAPWFSEIAAFTREHPEADIGLHLTITSETDNHRWRPLADPATVPSLVDEHGYLHRRWAQDADINPHDVERELRAQIEKAYGAGLRPTHIDSHQFRLQMRGKPLFDAYARLGREYGLPILAARQWSPRYPYLDNAPSFGHFMLDGVAIIRDDVKAESWRSYYARLLNSLRPGVTEVLIHPGYDDDELRTAFGERLAWGAAWRQRDFDFFTSDEFRSLLVGNDIKLITWREISNALH